MSSIKETLIEKFDLSTIDTTVDNIPSYDLLLLVTDHSCFDYDLFQQHAQLILDTRGLYQEPFGNVVKA